MSKEARYELLVRDRKACNACAPELQNLSKIEEGSFDSSHIGPYSRWQGNLYASLMIVGKDFADLEALRTHRGWPGAKVRTNVHLVDLVREAGIAISGPQFGSPDDQLFFTNGVLCIKQGGMSAKVSPTCFEQCGRRFLRRTIDLVAPRVVVSLGVDALTAVCSAYDEARVPDLETVAGQALPLHPDLTFVPVYHPSRYSPRSRAEQRADWARIGSFLAGSDHVPMA